MPPFQVEGESAFNFAQDYLKHISHLLQLCENYSMTQDVNSWCSSLRVIYRRICAKTLPLEDDEINKKFKDIYLILSDAKKAIEQKGKVLSMLDNLEVTIIKMAQKKGMLLPGKDDPRFAVLQR